MEATAPTYKGRSIFEYRAPRSGLQYSGDLEWRLAARWGGYKYFDEFLELDGRRQSDIVATYRCEMQMGAIVAHEQAKAMRRKNSRNSGK